MPASSRATLTTIFWDVDTQVDFLHPQGKLYVPGAEKIIPNLGRLTQWACAHGILVVASMDAHREGDAEFHVYPSHCLVGTPGQQKVPETRLPRYLIIPNHPVSAAVRLDGCQQVILEKQQLDVFSNPNTEALLAALGKPLQVVLYGVVTEICVAFAARGLLDRGHHVWLVRDAVRHLDEAKACDLVEEVEHHSGRLVTADDVVGGGILAVPPDRRNVVGR